MIAVKFTRGGARISRHLTSEDLESFGISVEEDLVWSDANDHTLSLEEGVARALVEQFSSEFSLVEEIAPPEETIPETADPEAQDETSSETEEESTPKPRKRGK